MHTLPTLNVELLSKIVTWAYADHNNLTDFIAEHFPGWGKWDQDVWSREIRNGVCQTSYCIAGNAVTQAGFALNLDFSEEEEVYENGEWKSTGRSIYVADYCYPATKNGKDAKGRQKYKRTGDDVYIPAAAREVLGLETYEGPSLFEGTNTIEKVVYLAKGFAMARGVSLDISDEISALSDRFDSYDNFANHVIAPYEYFESFFANLA